MSSVIRVGLISDTHGLLRPEVHQAFAGVDMILHAGDVCGDEILDELELIAPTTAVFGNCDMATDPRLAERIEITVGGLRIHVSHGHELGRPNPVQMASEYDADVYVYGHTHRQVIQRIGSKLIINPGSAGPQRFDLAPSVAVLTISDGVADAVLTEFVD